jgi:Metallo-peptidase family M12
MEIPMLNRQLCFALSLGCALAAGAGSGFGREIPSDVMARPEIDCGGQSSTVLLRVDRTQAITVKRGESTGNAHGCTWTGTVQETGESAMLMWWKNGRLTGMLSYNGHVYSVLRDGDEIRAVREVGPRMAPASGHTDASDARGAARSAQKPGKWPSLLAADTPAVEPFSDAERLAMEAKKITIDLMVLYTSKAASHYIRDPAEVVALAVEQTNQTFRNSGLANINLRLVHTQSIDYDEIAGEHFGHLYGMVDGVGPLKAIRKLRDEKRADIVGLIVDDPSSCGLSTRVGADAEEAYFVAHHSCAAIAYSLAHEVGHILGARHDRQTDGNNAPFPFGHGYVNGNKWRDLMSYQDICGGCPRIPYWSNPRIMYKGEPTGTVANDNARVILGQAERVSNFR